MIVGNVNYLLRLFQGRLPIRKYLYAGILLGVFLAFIPGRIPAQSEEFFRIGTSGTGGTYYPIGGLLALVISNPPGSRSCERGGSCGVIDLIAVAQSSNGSVSNIKAIAAGTLESGFSQSDVAYWAYTGTGIFANDAPLTNLRTITNLYPESIHLVALQGSEIKTVQDLKGKRVSLDEPGSGTLVDARIILAAYGLSEEDILAQYIKPEAAASMMEKGELDAFFIVAGYPTSSVYNLTAKNGAKLINIDGINAENTIEEYGFFAQNEIPAGTYPNIPHIKTLSVGAQWIVSTSISEERVYEITKALWNKTSRRLLDNGHPKAKSIVLDKALDGLGIPLHPGAERYYRENGLVQ